MKILAIAGELNPARIGGAEAHFIEVSKRLKPKIEKLTVISNIRYPRIPNLSWLTYSLFIIPHALKENFDLIWLKQEYLGWAGLILKIITGKPVYVTCQNPNLATEEWVGKGVLAKFFQKYFGQAFNYFLMFPLRFMDVVAAVSSYSAGLARKLGAKKVVVVPNGVDIVNHDVSIHRSYPDQKITIITTSSLIPRNGIDILIQACALLPSDIRWKLIIAGDGPEEKDLQRLAGNLPVKFLGRVPPDKIPGLLKVSDLFVRPSRFEGFGNSFIEAMAAGVPVIGTPVGGIVDFLFDGKTGFLVPVDDAKALSKKISYLNSHPEQMKRVAAFARKYIRENYDWDIIAEKVFKEMSACL